MTEPISVVIPVFNEDENIIQTLKSYRDHVLTPSEFYLVYDFDEDTTLPIIRKHQSDFPELTLVKNKYGRGVLNAIKTGIESSTGIAVLVTMADGSDEYSHVDKMYEKIKQGYAVVCGSRYMRGGEQIGGPFIKSLLSRLAGWSLHILSQIPTHDISNSFKMYAREAIQSINIESQGGFEIGMEITVKAYLKGLKIAEVPTSWKDRESGKSNFKLVKWLPKYLHWYFYLLQHKYLG